MHVKNWNWSLLIGCLLISAVACSFLPGCGSNTSNDNTVGGKGTITGRVLDDGDATLWKVRISAGGVQTDTDVDGNFILDNVPAGDQTVSATLSGYFDTGAGNKSIHVGDGGTYSAGTLILAKLVGSNVLLYQLTPHTTDYQVHEVLLGGKIYTYSLKCYNQAEYTAPATASYKIDQHYSRFQSVVGGIDDSGDVDEMVFKVYGDGILLYTSGNLKPGIVESIDIDISTVGTLKLEVWAAKINTYTGVYAWGDPKLTVKATP